MQASELGNHIGDEVSVEIEGKVGEPTYFRQGILLAVSEHGIVLSVRGEPSIILMDGIVDIKPALVVRKVVRRKVRYIPEHQARQHLLDRHNLSWSMIKEMTPATAWQLHQRIDHTDLGHRHRPEGEGGEE